MQTHFRFLVVCVLVGLGVLTGSPGASAAAPSLPAGFSRVPVVTGLHSPTAFTFQGKRIFVAERAGTVRVTLPDGTLRAKPFLTVHVSLEAERGLLGIAIDPRFSINRFVYVYYTTGPGSKRYTGTPLNRVSRFTTKHGVGRHERILIDNIPSDLGYHNAGDLHFGFDDKLYVTIGDGGKEWGDAGLLNNLRGKILRVNRNGTAPPDNPFYNTPGALPEIFAYGFRNPFRLALRPANSSYIVGDVGFNTWEELDSLEAGADYGWWRYEGPCLYAKLDDCEPTQTDFGVTTPPIHYYNHNTGAEQGNAVIAGAFPVNSNYPAPYADAFFYGDFGHGWVHAITLDNTNHVTASSDFDTLSSPVTFGTGPDGNVYVASHSLGEIYKYVYTP